VGLDNLINKGDVTMKLLMKLLSVFIIPAILFSVFEARAESDAEKIAIVKAVDEAWGKLNVPLILSYFAEDAVFIPMYSGQPVSKAQLKERWTKLLESCTRLDIQVRNMGVINGAVFLERLDDFDVKGKHGKCPVVAVIEIKNGKIVEWREYYDRNQLLTEMGIIKKEEKK
jgi:limonene-1,2-epoxide hydrolase